MNLKKEANKNIFTIGFLTSMVALLVGCNISISTPTSSTLRPQSTYLKDVYKDYFTFGTAVQKGNLDKYSKLLTNFNSVTAEYQMKWGQTEKEENKFSYESADYIIDWAKENNVGVRGHCLLWYKSLPAWVKEKNFNKQQALDAIDKHVKETMEHYGNSVYCWDVLNEALKNTVTQKDLTNDTFYRTGNMTDPKQVDWYQIAGEDFIKQVFKSANDAKELYNLDDVALFYNDYGLNNPYKREACVRLVKMLLDSNIKVDGIGMQSHYRLSKYLEDRVEFLSNFEDSIKAFTELGVDVHITELDIRVYARDDDPKAFDKLPHDIEVLQGEMYGDLLEICRDYATPWKEEAGRVSNVTVWGVSDDKNSWATDSHEEFPLLFDEEHQPKEAFYEIISF